MPGRVEGNLVNLALRDVQVHVFLDKSDALSQAVLGPNADFSARALHPAAVADHAEAFVANHIALRRLHEPPQTGAAFKSPWRLVVEHSRGTNEMIEAHSIGQDVVHHARYSRVAFQERIRIARLLVSIEQRKAVQRSVVPAGDVA